MTVVLDTRSVPQADRRDYWSAGIAEHFFSMHVEAVGAPSFEAMLAGGQVGPVAARSIQGLPHRAARTSRMVAAADPECILLYLLTRGQVRLEQDDRCCVLHPGDIAFQDTSRSSVFEARDRFEVLVFTLPKWFIGTRADGMAHRSATRVAVGEGRLTSIAVPFLTGLARMAADDGACTGRDGEDAAEMLLPMLHGMYRDEERLPARSPARPHSQELLMRMQRYAEDHLEDPRLGPERLAQAHFVSTRYAHKLFAASGTGVTAWIRERRLEGAMGELRASPGTAIATVAESWGYRSPASFSRAFRDRYGCAPRDVRRAAEPVREVAQGILPGR